MGPDNLAFENLNALENVQEILFNTREGQPMFTNVLLSHVAEGYIASDQLSCNGEVTTLFGTSQTICDSVTGPIFQVGPGNTEDEFRPKYDSKYGIEACNGIIYAISNVILPLQSLQSSPIVEVEEGEGHEHEEEEEGDHDHDHEEEEHEHEEESSTTTSTNAAMESPVTSTSMMMNNNNSNNNNNVRGDCVNKKDYTFKGITCAEVANPNNNKCKKVD